MKLRVVIASLLLLASSGCVIVGGYSPGRGLWIWPGSILILIVGLVLFLMMILRRRRP